MAYQVLARKWRPKKFQDVIGQQHITRSLQNAILRDKTGQAYIFTGTRGIGKTSVARLFAKALRCEAPNELGNPCNQCACCEDFNTGSSMNILEIDGASNNGVDNIRDLISEVQYLPSVGKYKIYIIDEVHMVTTQAFNALLKTLEEPPAHVIFLFATTEPEKLLGTVLSRCQRFDFRHATVPDLTEHLKTIAAAEEIVCESDDLLKQIAIQGKGSVRDTLSLLDQVLSFADNNRITEETLVVSLGLARSSAIWEMIAAMLAGDAKSCSSIYRELINENVSVKNIYTALLDALFELIENIDDSSLSETLGDVSAPELFWVYENLAKDAGWILESFDPEKIGEVELQKVALRRTFFQRDNIKVQAPVEEKKNNTVEPEPIVEVQTEPQPEAVVEAQPEPQPEPVIEVQPEPQPEPVDSEPPMPEEAPHPAEDCNSFIDSVEESQEAPAVEEQSAPKELTWEAFLDNLRKVSMITASNLEQGNITSPVHMEGDNLVVDLGFDEAGKVFLDYLSELEVKNKILGFLSDYFEVPVNTIKFNFSLITEENFKSMAELEQQRQEEDTKKREEDFVNSDIIQEAQDIFSGKIDRVIVSKEQK